MRISDWSSDVCSSDLIVAVIVPDEEEANAWATRNNLADKSFADLCSLPAFKAAVFQQITVSSSRCFQCLPPNSWFWISENRRVGKECIRSCRSRRSQYH